MAYTQTDLKNLSAGELALRHLSVDFQTDRGIVHAVRDVSFHVRKGRILRWSERAAAANLSHP